jgi:DNA-binding transcriptional regulator YdaS (Cro superfamily)
MCLPIDRADRQPYTSGEMTYDQLISHYGTQSAAASALGINQSSVSEWKERGSIPRLRQLHIEILTKGKLKADPSAKRPDRQVAA